MKQKLKVAVIGSGTIGASWALCFAWKGMDTTLFDIGQSQLAAARQNIESNLKVLEENHILSKKEAAAIADQIKMTIDLKEAVQDADFIQECGPESYEIKWDILRQIEAYADENTVIASSTSGLFITEEAKYMQHPERLVGGHPYNPPHLLPLVEIVKGREVHRNGNPKGL